MLKDENLDRMAESGLNVAQFFSVSPEQKIRFRRMCGYTVDSTTELQLADLAERLLNSTASSSVCIRTFKKDRMQSNPFIFGLDSVESIVSNVSSLTSQGYYVIVNENLELDDGGVSGVIQDSIVEFGPGITPRDVENSTTPLPVYPRELGVKLHSL